MPGLSPVKTPATAPELTFDDVRRALHLPRPGLAAQTLMWPQRPPGIELPGNGRHGRDAAVLILIYPISPTLHLVLTRRTETVQNHKGQISLPGGAHEGAESLQQTALREAHEELAVDPAGLEILGSLTPLYVGVSDYLITPVVALTAHRPDFHPDPVEVVEAIDMPLALLLDPGARREEDWQIRGFTVHVPFFAVGPHKVWGATAMILAELAALLETTV
jgi:8-oxo-dGTP pyrophosphatase MutT (NUDIX family)